MVGACAGQADAPPTRVREAEGPTNDAPANYQRRPTPTPANRAMPIDQAWLSAGFYLEILPSDQPHAHQPFNWVNNHYHQLGKRNPLRGTQANALFWQN